MLNKCLFALAAAALALGCQSRGQPAEPRAPEVTGATVPGPAMSDAQIVAVTGVANSAEIEQGQLAAARAQNPRVKAFAQHTVKDHMALARDQNDLEQRLHMSANPNDTSSRMTTEASETLALLKASSGGDFDRAYMAAQIERHGELLNALDTRLLPNAHDGAVRDQLRDMRDIVKSHLDEAQDIMNSLMR
jgi:putative membrane protein